MVEKRKGVVINTHIDTFTTMREHGSNFVSLPDQKTTVAFLASNNLSIRESNPNSFLYTFPGLCQLKNTVALNRFDQTARSNVVRMFLV